MKQTGTYAIMSVSHETFEEIRGRLKRAGYAARIQEGHLVMEGLVLARMVTGEGEGEDDEPDAG